MCVGGWVGGWVLWLCVWEGGVCVERGVCGVCGGGMWGVCVAEYVCMGYGVCVLCMWWDGCICGVMCVVCM